MSKEYYVYFLTNKINTVLYTGVTNDLERRVWEHKNKAIEGFTKKYNLNKLVYYEVYCSPGDAIAREKQLKNWSRSKKEFLIDKINSDWKDLSMEWYERDPSTALGMTEGGGCS